MLRHKMQISLYLRTLRKSIKFFFVNLLVVVILSIMTDFLRLKFNISFKEVNIRQLNY